MKRHCVGVGRCVCARSSNAAVQGRYLGTVWVREKEENEGKEVIKDEMGKEGSCICVGCDAAKWWSQDAAIVLHRRGVLAGA